MEKGVKPTQVDIVGRVNQLLRDCHELAVSTGSFSVLLFVIDDEVHCWASPELEGLVGDHQSRKLLNSLLLDPPTSKERQEAIALYLSGKETADVFPGFKVEEEDRQVDFIQNVDQREKRFKELVAGIYAGAEDLAKLDSPLSGKNYEYFFVVAVVTGKIFTFSTPALKPIVGSEHGRKLISTLLETTLKQLAEEGDPEAARRELAAIERAKAKEQAEKE